MRYFVALCLCLLCLALLVGFWSWPKNEKFNLADPLSCDRYYHGFGLTNSRGIFGKNYYRIDTVLTLPEDGWCKIDYDNANKKHPFLACYPNGNLRAKGYCSMDLDHLGQPMGMQSIVDGIFYSPDGSVTSEVHEDIGTETLWMPDGVKIWEAQREKCPIKITLWHRNGQLRVVESYKNGKKDGVFNYYTPDGLLNCTIVFKEGVEIKRSNVNPDVSPQL